MLSAVKGIRKPTMEAAMTESEKLPPKSVEVDEDDADAFEVVELESEDGELEELVIIDRLELDGAVFTLMASLEEVEAAEDMTEEEIEETFGEDGLVFLMREDGETYTELTEEEHKAVKEAMDRRIAENEALAAEDE